MFAPVRTDPSSRPRASRAPASAVASSVHLCRARVAASVVPHTAPVVVVAVDASRVRSRASTVAMELPRAIAGAMDRAREARERAIDATTEASSRMDRASSDAAFALVKAMETAMRGVSDVVDDARTRGEAVVERARESEDEFFRSASKRVVDFARANPVSVGGTVACAVALALPAPRALLWRSTIGRLQSEEALFNACVRRSERLTLEAEAASAEIQRLAESVSAAEIEMKRGASNLRAAARELRAIESKTYGMDSKASGLLNDLRVLPSAEAAALQEQVAGTTDTVAAHRSAALKVLKKIFKSGIEV